MFESWLEESLGDPGALLQLAADNLIVERRAGCRRLLVAAAWADCHGAPDDRVPDHHSALVDQFVQVGGMGTPLVSQDCAAELGHAIQVGVVTARKLVADALTIRHRLPLLWRRVMTGEVWAWKAAKVAEATRHLGGLSSWVLDRQTSPYLELMAWTRFLDVLDAALLDVDAATYQARAEQAAAQRDVRSYRGQHGLRTLIARAEAGEVAAFEALVGRVAACLAEDGDEDPVGVRRSKALGIIAHPARLRDLLARHADQADDPRHPEQRVAAHQADPSDPWAAEDLPDAGWETDRHGNVHQPGVDDVDDLEDSWTSHTDRGDDPDVDEEPPVDEQDQAWFDEQQHDLARHDDGLVCDEEPAVHPADQDGPDPDHDPADDESSDTTNAGGADKACRGDAGDETDDAGDETDGAGDTATDAGRSAGESDPTPGRSATPIPAAFDRDRGYGQRDHRGACTSCGSSFDLRPYTTSELAGSRTRVVLHVHVTDQTLINQHGVLRTADGPITLDQFRRWLTDADPTISIRPVLDPANVAAVDSYEIPLAIREAVHTRHPGSVFPFSPVTTISTGGRLDLDHTIAYRADGPPGQTAADKLGPVTRYEHQPKTHGSWQARQPHPGVYVWRSPHGWISLVTNQGTLLLGDNPFAHAVWQAAQPGALIATAG